MPHLCVKKPITSNFHLQSLISTSGVNIVSPLYQQTHSAPSGHGWWISESCGLQCEATENWVCTSLFLGCSIRRGSWEVGGRFGILGSLSCSSSWFWAIYITLLGKLSWWERLLWVMSVSHCLGVHTPWVTSSWARRTMFFSRTLDNDEIMSLPVKLFCFCSSNCDGI